MLTTIIFFFALLDSMVLLVATYAFFNNLEEDEMINFRATMFMVTFLTTPIFWTILYYLSH